MSNTPGIDFTQFVPGFDFMKNLGAGTGGSASAASAWIAPTMDPEELDKRIQELKTVQFWLEQNAKALGATIQAMEVQPSPPLRLANPRPSRRPPAWTPRSGGTP